MKKLYLSLLTVLLLFISLTSCTTLFDVTPKEIYSPIELDGSLVPIKLTESSCKVRFKGNDDSLNYGVLVFYDSIAAVSFVRARKTIGPVQAVKAVKSAVANQFVTENVSFDNTKGQFLYITPFAYRSADSLAIRTRQDYSKVFSSQGYMQLKISPWTHVTDVANVSTQDNIKLFTYQNSLAYFKYNRTQLTGYRLDNQNKKWTLLGDTKNSFCITGCNTSSAVNGYVNKVSDIYEVNNKIVAVSGTRANIGPVYNSIGVLSMKQDLSIETHTLIESVSGSPTEYYWSFDGIFSNLTTQNNLQVMYMKINTSGNGLSTFLSYQYYPLPISDGNILSAFLDNSTNFFTNAFTYTDSKSLPTSLPIKYNAFGPNLIKPYNIGIKVGNKFIINENQDINSFRLFSAGNTQIDEIKTSQVEQTLYNYLVRPKLYGVLTCIPGENEGYIFLVNQAILKVSVVNTTIKISNLYSNWFPYTTSKSITQGLSLNNKLYVLLNGFEIWEFDPSQLTIDFTRPGAVTIVSL